MLTSLSLGSSTLELMLLFSGLMLTSEKFEPFFELFSNETDPMNSLLFNFREEIDLFFFGMASFKEA